MRIPLLLTSGLFVLAACSDTACPVGTIRAGSACAVLNGYDAAIGEMPGSDAASERHDGGLNPEARCLVDGDHDGFGVDGVLGSCGTSVDGAVADVAPGDCDDDDPSSYPEAPVNRCDQADNDCDGKAEAPVEETCNGEDDDCVDGVDNEVTNACGACGEVPDEACNGTDDDCDGVVDQNLVEKLATTGEQVFTQAGNNRRTDVALIPRTAGGGFLVYGARESATSVGSQLNIHPLDSSGIAGPALDSTVTKGAREFLVDHHGEWAVILSRKAPSGSEAKDDSSWLRLQLFRTEDMSFTSDYYVVSYPDDDDQLDDKNDADDCDSVSPLDVAVLEDATGAVHMAVVYQDSVGSRVSGVCTSTTTTLFRVVTFSPAGAWSMHAPITIKGRNPDVTRLPCSDSWLLLQADDAYEARHLSAEGDLIASDLDTFDDVELVDGVGTDDALCATEGGAVVITYSQKLNETGEALEYARLWQIDADGKVKRIGQDQLLPGEARDAVPQSVDGRWFIAARGINPVDHYSEGPLLWEVSFLAGGSRVVPLILPGGADAGFDAFPALHGAALIDAGEAIVAAYPNTSTGGGNLDDFRPIGVTDPAVAVTYRIGCN